MSSTSIFIPILALILAWHIVILFKGLSGKPSMPTRDSVFWIVGTAVILLAEWSEEGAPWMTQHCYLLWSIMMIAFAVVKARKQSAPRTNHGATSLVP